MADDEDITQNASGGGASLDGYLYQVDISIWAALDLLLAKKLGQQVVLEPQARKISKLHFRMNSRGALPQS
ncbi:hypothetical protein IVA98_00820 [Bradyrhizobium sp. 160]|uniref:hypothetical protein n=1 Tax=Bradyrhizobium sp. 160 TaxID=2782634 RepID=UPI001FFA5127|nr:hypothetical protein [Bradyrhizobium sp. 160]MCK1621819.1 hypothetical protein [Bradyrhizobium sp. 160]